MPRNACRYATAKEHTENPQATEEVFLHKNDGLLVYTKKRCADACHANAIAIPVLL